MYVGVPGRPRGHIVDNRSWATRALVYLVAAMTLLSVLWPLPASATLPSPPERPALDTSFDDLSLDNGETHNIDVAHHFSGEDVFYKVTISTTHQTTGVVKTGLLNEVARNKVTGTWDGTVLTLTGGPAAAQIVGIEISAINTGGSVSDSFDLYLSMPLQEAPLALETPFEDLSLDNGQTVTIDMADHFTGDDLTYEVTVTTTNQRTGEVKTGLLNEVARNKVTGTWDGTVLTLTGGPATAQKVTIEITATSQASPEGAASAAGATSTATDTPAADSGGTAAGSFDFFLAMEASDPPGQPQQLEAHLAPSTDDPSKTDVTLRWLAPEANGGSPVKYIVAYGEWSESSGDGTHTTLDVEEGLSHTLTGLTVGTIYYFKVAAVNDGGTGPLTDNVFVRVPAAPPAAPANLATKLIPAVYSDPASAGTIGVQWDCDVAVYRYKVEYRVGDTGDWVWNEDLDRYRFDGESGAYCVSVRATTIEPEEPDTTLTFRVTPQYHTSGTGNLWWGPASTYSLVVPSAPTAPTITGDLLNPNFGIEPDPETPWNQSHVPLLIVYWEPPTGGQPPGSVEYVLEYRLIPESGQAGAWIPTDPVQTSEKRLRVELGKSYEVRMHARNDMWTSDPTAPVTYEVPTVADMEAAQVTGVVATRPSSPLSQILDLSWDSLLSDDANVPTLLLDYDIEQEECDVEGKNCEDDVVNWTSVTTNKTIGPLEFGHSYNIRVRATLNSHSLWSDQQSVVLAPFGAPGSVQSLMLDLDGQGTVDVSWQTPEHTGLSAITHYEVQYSKSETFSSPSVVRSHQSDGTLTSGCTAATETEPHECTVTSLDVGDTYYFRVRAVNAEGGSVWSTSSILVPVLAPYELEVDEVISATSVKLGWKRVAGASDDFAIRYRVKPDGVWTTTTLLFVLWPHQTDVEWTVLNLTAGETYQFALVALQNGKQSVPASVLNSDGTVGSSPLEVTLPSTEPSAPTGLTATAAGSGEVRLVWDQASGATRYRVWNKQKTAYDWTLTHVDAPSEGNPESLLAGLENKKAYHFKVQANNVGGWWGPASDVVEATPVGAAPGAVVGYSLRSINSKPAPTSTGEVDVLWGSPSVGDPVTSYEVEYSTQSDLSSSTTVSTSGSSYYTQNGASHLLKVPDLTVATKYYFRLRGVNDAGNGPWSDKRSITVDSSRQPTLTASLSTDGSGTASLSWTLPDGVDASTDTGWVIEQSRSWIIDNYPYAELQRTWRCDLTAVSPGCVRGSFTTPADDPLVGDSQYDWRVRVIDAGGYERAWSDRVGFRSTYTAPVSAPSKLEVDQVLSATSVRLGWETASGETTTKYRIRYRVKPAEGGEETAWSTTDVTLTAVPSDRKVQSTLTGLTAETTYQIEVRAVHATQGWVSPPATVLNTDGTDGDSPLEVTMPAAGNALGKPEILGATSTQPTIVIVTWRTTADADNYRVYWRAKPAAGEDGAWSRTRVSHLPGGGLRNYLITNLDSTTVYEFKVQASNTNGWWGPHSDVLEGFPAGLVPSVPRSLDLEAASPGKVNVSWMTPTQNADTISAYTVEYSSNADYSSSTTVSSTDTSASYTQTGDDHLMVLSTLTIGTEYHFRVRGTNDVGNGQWSDWESFTLPVFAPYDFDVSNVLSTSIEFRWKRVEGAATGFRIDYRVKPDPGEDQAWTEQDVIYIGDPTTSYNTTLFGLTAGETYEFVLVARKNGKVSAPAAVLNSDGTAGTSPLEVTLPSSDAAAAPTGLSAAAAGSGEVRLTWDSGDRSDSLSSAQQGEGGCHMGCDLYGYAGVG